MEIDTKTMRRVEPAFLHKWMYETENPGNGYKRSQLAKENKPVYLPPILQNCVHVYG